MEKFGQFKFKLFPCALNQRWHYKIYDHTEKPIVGLSEFFTHRGIARYAAIGHMTVLESKKINSEAVRS